jgi:hypothetical protein
MTAGLSINLVCVKVRSVAANISVCVAIVGRRFYHKLSPREFHPELLVILISILPDGLILVAGRQEAGLVIGLLCWLSRSPCSCGGVSVLGRT